VYPLPPVLPENPHLDLLYAPMQRWPILVRRDRPRQALPALLLGQGRRVLHLHFFDELTQRRAPGATIMRSLAFLALLRLLDARGVRLAWTAHNIMPHEAYHPRLAALVYREVARQSAVTIAHSHAARDEVTARYQPRRTAVIPIGNFAGVYGPPRERRECRLALNLPQHEPVTLLLGALRRYKHAEGLIDAFASLPEAERGTLLIAGRARERGYAAELRQRSARVSGVRIEDRHIPDDELALYLGAVDLLALPYQRLLTSAVLMLALSYGRPVLAPAIGPVKELVAHGREGILFDPAAPAALAGGLQQALDSDLCALGQRGFERARQFEWDAIARATYELYRDIA
jgi:glycosyltransferase involved in cell wall biosynthesis